jgi:hypothetical protein
MLGTWSPTPTKTETRPPKTMDAAVGLALELGSQITPQKNFRNQNMPRQIKVTPQAHWKEVINSNEHNYG